MALLRRCALTSCFPDFSTLSVLPVTEQKRNPKNMKNKVFKNQLFYILFSWQSTIIWHTRAPSWNRSLQDRTWSFREKHGDRFTRTAVSHISAGGPPSTWYPLEGIAISPGKPVLALSIWLTYCTIFTSFASAAFRPWRAP